MMDQRQLPESGSPERVSCSRPSVYHLGDWSRPEAAAEDYSNPMIK